MSTLAANLAALRLRDAALAERIERAQPAALEWSDSRDGPVVASYCPQGKPVQLASRYDPMKEAAQITASIDYQKHAGIVLLGMGLGYHAACVAGKLDDSGILILYEPDIALLRAVLERIDHSGWLRCENVVLADDAMDRAALIGRIEPHAAKLTQGTILVTHPVTRRQHGQALKAFGQMVAQALAYCRTHVATALVNAARTYRNLAMNLPHYVGGADTNALHKLAQGYPAVCVAAGPSLAKNVHLLQDADVRRNVVVITAQTTLKPLLARGIEPDFVTALDYHEISRRFYEGLGEMSRVTLVAQPLANPAILGSFPGPIRVTQSGFLDRMLGELAPTITPVRYGSTVAHLSFYLAQHLGCDPIIFIGQDLAFSNGLYYSPGTAIHDVWAPELNAFNTLEMMEWQRIVRHRNQLHKLEDIDGHAIYSDEQMVTYLRQFERDFGEANQTIIDATEGGLPKAHSVRMTLAAALERYATRPTPEIPVPRAGLDGQRLRAAAKCVTLRLEEVREIRLRSNQTIPLLKEMARHQKDARRVDRLFRDITRHKDRVMSMDAAFALVNDLNSVGVFNRARADRAIHHDVTDAYDRQRHQIDRDVTNLDWMIQAADETIAILTDALNRLHEAIAHVEQSKSDAVARGSETQQKQSESAVQGCLIEN